MKNMNKAFNKTQIIAALVVTASVISLGAGAAAVRFAGTKKEASAPVVVETFPSQVQTMTMENDLQNTPKITALEMNELQPQPTEAAEVKKQNPEMVLDLVDTTLRTGEKVTLKAALIHGDSNPVYTWKTDDSGIAAITPNGDSAVITAKKPGTAIITVSNGNAKDTCIVRVKAAETFYLSTDKKTLEEGDHYTVTASSNIASVKTSNKNVATVSYEGTKAYVSAKNPGTATVTVTGKNGKSATVAITVEAYGLTLNKSTMSLKTGEVKDLYVTFGHTPTWYMDDSNVVRIHGSGKNIQIEAIGEGTTTLTAVASNGARAYCTVTVKADEKPLQLSVSEMTMKAGELKDIYVISGSASNWTVSNEDIAEIYVIGDGSMVQVQAKAEGTVVINAFTANNKCVTCYVTVEPAVQEKVLADNFGPIGEMVCEPLYIEEVYEPAAEEAAPAAYEAPAVEEAPAPIVEEAPAPVVEEVSAPVVEEAPVVMEMAVES